MKDFIKLFTSNAVGILFMIVFFPIFLLILIAVGLGSCCTMSYGKINSSSIAKILEKSGIDPDKLQMDPDSTAHLTKFMHDAETLANEDGKLSKRDINKLTRSIKKEARHLVKNLSHDQHLFQTVKKFKKEQSQYHKDHSTKLVAV